MTKLIDIIVRELPKRGGWPDDLNSSQNIHIAGIGWCMPPWGCSPMCYELASHSIVTKEQYTSAVASASHVEWDGVGLPPVGCECECYFVDGWRPVKVVYKGHPASNTEALVFDIETTRPAWADEFRPIRTDAERKREDFLDSVRPYLTKNVPFIGYNANELYDAIAAGKIPGVELSK